MLRFDYRNLLANNYIPTAIENKRLDGFAGKCQEADQDIRRERQADILGFYTLPEYDTKHIKSYVSQLDPEFDTMVVLGIGGSALGNKALYNALKTELGLKRKLFVYDNVDPVYLQEILDSIDLQHCVFNVITKSGTTAETMAGYMILLDLIKKKFPQDYRKRVVITTDREKGFLRQVINNEGYSSFIVPDNVGGRFSVLTDVGLLSSAFVGMDIDKLLWGAGQMRQRCENQAILENPAYLNGLLHFLYMREGKNVSVMMPYSNSLYDFADWYRQLWAESLGKRYDRKGREVFVGQTPVKALGTTDQHSQVQLYAEGPRDKVFTFLTVEKFQHDFVIPNLHPERPEVSYLGGKKLSELLNAERFATEIALTRAGRPNCNLIFPEISEETLGEAIMMYEIQTVFTGKLLNIDPLDQPGVEAGKVATYALMGKAGFDKERNEIEEYKKL
ncbi:MAG: glucose-6-phosphate isomerase [Candidatus Cloacimonetes bacterium]|jgi:glucose-6-phosphate isomerase|nr:glucose-6-phosphate isomerase [Candidatus Cloacimonadota bacterium]MDD2543233.1 glucose-6-phosphate isomerase [Candidatus Cloacimonadota bacterium]MDD2682873.1 glucose-6-phosphate isomerase [Candidatus Cloacimonadota bacterium]MDD4034310.1 glucose-6-phosphate isomerase [Candidatus Cloacimonadota bacterium]MDD4666769.1 glucose-6-phosphate isomerase [Candidatus Cloacimonadota bacterium]